MSYLLTINTNFSSTDELEYFLHVISPFLNGVSCYDELDCNKLDEQACIDYIESLKELYMRKDNSSLIEDSSNCYSFDEKRLQKENIERSKLASSNPPDNINPLLKRLIFK